MTSTKKHEFPSYCWVPLVTALFVILCSSVVVILQQKCMNSKTNDFVDSYCLDDNRMRAVITFVLILIILATAKMLSSAVNSFRTCRLSSGINEGLFVAMASGLTYKLKSIKQGGVGLVILFIILFVELSPELLQIVSSVAITTETVLVKTQAKTEIVSKRIDYGLGVDSAKNNQMTNPPGGSSNGDIAAATATSGDPERSVVQKNKVVVTNVVREGFALNITGEAKKNGDLSFPHTDVVATVSSNCSVQRQEQVSFPDDGNAYIKIMVDGTGVASQFNSTYITNIDTAIFDNTKTIIYCEKHSCNITASLCTSKINLSRSSFIYTPSNKKVTITRLIDNNVTINIPAFADLINGLIGVPEYFALNYGMSNATQQDVSAIQGMLGTQLNQTLGKNPAEGASIIADVTEGLIKALPDATSATTHPAGLSFTRNAILSSRTIGVGLFDGIVQNELHARVCASAALTLSDLQAYSFAAANDIIALGQVTTGALYGNTTNKNLYIPVTQAYMPTYFAAILFVFFVILSCLLVTVDLVSFKESLINVKDANELAFIDNIGKTMAKRQLKHYFSNNTNEQENAAFDNILYCREGKNSNGDVVIFIQYENTGQKPSKNEFYY